MRRRELFAGLGAAAVLAACSSEPTRRAAGPAPRIALPPVQLSPDRIIKITVCTRPFRAAGPRLDVEQIGAKTVVHNYGHGGSGWSLSWGSGTIATRNALASGQRHIAVIGCGALGLTCATLLQRAGAQVTIYAKELPPQTRSTFATGEWTPDSRICLASQATPAFKQLWQQMARTSYLAYTNLLGLPGSPVEYVDNYDLTDVPYEQAMAQQPADTVQMADLQQELIPELMTKPRDLPPGSTPFAVPYARLTTGMMFNLTAYQRLLVSDFVANGGKIVITEFHTPEDFSRLSETVLVNCTGFGARALLGDQSITPVRGQLARLIPDEAVHYGWTYQNVLFLPRRDGFLVQAFGQDSKGMNDDTVVPDRAEADNAVALIARAGPRQPA
jgi:glycine/D-amino acid oxidase-like deaminating enzyme